MLTSDQKIKINEKVQGFKEAADFYRMEYSHYQRLNQSGDSNSFLFPLNTLE